MSDIECTYCYGDGFATGPPENRPCSRCNGTGKITDKKSTISDKKLTLDQYQQLKRKADESQRESDKAAGALEQMKSRIKSEFDCKSIDDAKKLLDKLEKEEKELNKEFQVELEQFKEKWPQVLE